MTDLTTIRPETDASAAPVAESVGASPALATVTSAQTPTLITEPQVKFSTAAAVTAAPAKTRRWIHTIGSVADAVRAWFAEAAKPPRPRHAKRYDFLEDARMAREMDRL